MKQLDSRAADEESFRNSEWTSEANDTMIRDAHDFKTPHGTIGSLIEKTPKELISKVFLEDKLFETWYNGRVVLIGDGEIAKTTTTTTNVCVQKAKGYTKYNSHTALIFPYPLWPLCYLVDC